MKGFPPAPENRVTVANWQDPPFNRWSFSHLRELVPTQRIARGDGPVGPLPAAPAPVDRTATLRSDGTVTTVGTILEETFTDGIVIVHDGAVVHEEYRGETRRDTPHLLMSVTKSMVGCVLGNLVEQGLLATDRLVTDYVPELAGSGYHGATVRDLLDMRSGIRFSEEYTDPNAEVRVFEQAALWRPPTHDAPASLYQCLPALTAARPHGGRFEYRSCETDVLGWVGERAAGARMADLIGELVWRPLGPEYDAEITCDGVGTAVHDGGMCATTVDLARFGMMLLAGGRAAGRPVVPAGWLASSWDPGPEVIAAFRGDAVNDAADEPAVSGWYRNQFWFLPGAHGIVLLCLGIHGQLVYVNPATGTVAAKTSSWPTAQAPGLLQDTLCAMDAVAGALAGRPLDIPAARPGLPGVAAGR